MRSNTSVLFI